MRVDNLPISYYKKGMPNICQTNPKNDYLRKEGKAFCGPASVADGLIWLSKYYFRSLVPSMGNKSELTVKLKLVKELAKYMEVESSGVSPSELVTGLKKYVRDRGYKVETHWKGIEHNDKYHCGELTSLNWLMENMIGTSNVVLDIKFRKTELFTPLEHCVISSGFNRKYNEFFIHDPSNRYTPLVCEIEKVTDGRQRAGLVSVFGNSKVFYKINEYDSKEQKWLDNIANLTGAIAFRVFRK